MTTRRFKPFSILAALPAIALFAILQACGGSDYARADETPDKIEGVWEAVVTATNCSTGAALATFVGASTYHRGGTLTNTDASPTITRGVGFGTWSKGAGPAYTVKFRYYQYDSAGALIGTRRVTRNATLAADGNSQTATVTNELFSPSGASLGSACSTDVATRAL